MRRSATSIAPIVAAVVLTTTAACASADRTVTPTGGSTPAARESTDHETAGEIDTTDAMPPSSPEPGSSADGSNRGQPVRRDADGTPSVTEVYVPPAGRYLYDTSGFSESDNGATRRRTEAPPESVDEVAVTRHGGATEVRTQTTYSASSSQETTVIVTEGDARLTRLSYRSTNAGVTTEQSVTPQPSIPVARLPYLVGDRRESAWSDPTLGIQGVGWSAALRRETTETSFGAVATVVLQLHQRLRGSITGELDVTSWIDPSTGVVVRQVLVTDLQDATGATHSEITRVLRGRPQ